MALYTTLASLSTTATSNAADGSTDAPSTIDQQNNLLASFIAQLRDQIPTLVGQAGGVGDRNLLINGNFAVNQRAYTSGTGTTIANQYTLDRWKVTTLGQAVFFAAGTPDVSILAPVGGISQVIEGANIVGGVYTLSWVGTATATVNGVAIANGGNTSSLPANTNVTIQFGSGTVGTAQFELGTVATPYGRRNRQIETALCQRYYESGLGELQAYNLAGNGTAVRIPFKVTKRVTPTLGYTVSVSTNCTTFDARSATPEGLTWFATPTATGTIAWLGTWTATAEL